jgi:hypothetical protein
VTGHVDRSGCLIVGTLALGALVLAALLFVGAVAVVEILRHGMGT